MFEDVPVQLLPEGEQGRPVQVPLVPEHLDSVQWITVSFTFDISAKCGKNVTKVNHSSF